jgi:hypothetical protein
VPSAAPGVGKVELKVMARCRGRDGTAWMESTVASVLTRSVRADVRNVRIGAVSFLFHLAAHIQVPYAVVRS